MQSKLNRPISIERLHSCGREVRVDERVVQSPDCGASVVVDDGTED